MTLEAQAFDGSGDALSNQSGPQTITLAGASWTQRSTDATSASFSQSLHYVIIGTTHESHLVIIEYGSLTSAFPNLDETMFQRALGAFAFLR
ncbi:MAG: hypothetical protein ACRDHE_04760 [Ktedonobacterales bacterium]